MCGIIGYIGHRPAVPLLIEGLKRLEYRGYDSAGIAFIQNKQLAIIKTEGKISKLEDEVFSQDVLHATIGIGHTRWATHGEPVTKNAHPHRDMEGKIALIHNGIIENYKILKDELLSQGYEFVSDTDTEVLVHLISREYEKTKDPHEAILSSLKLVDGSYAIGVIFLDRPKEIWVARHSSPLVIGVGVGENFVASDVPAFLPYTKKVLFLEDGEIARVGIDFIEVFNIEKKKVEKKVMTIPWDITLAQKGGYKHFMIKEIMEQPKVIYDAVAGRIDHCKMKVELSQLDLYPLPEKIHIVACGTSYHAGFWGKYVIERLSRIPVEVDIASEFRYRDPIINERDWVIVISQSGETADTLAGLRLVKDFGANVIGVCNVVGSSVARESSTVLYTQAGPEISVASTKAMCSQMVVLLLVATYMAQRKNVAKKDVIENILRNLKELPALLEKELPKIRQRARELAIKYSFARSFFFLGRGLFYPLALEGALKLKEISYIHAEGYAAGEMKHGPIALVDQTFPSFVIAPKDGLLQKVIANIKEIQARQGPVICLTNKDTDVPVTDRWDIPYLNDIISSFFILSATQLFAYEMAVYLGKDVDQPRNLAKSVTVE